MAWSYNRTENLGTMEVVQSELGRDERLLWAGKPVGGIRLQAEDFIMIPFSIMWAGFAFFWEFMALMSDAPFFMKLWGIPFVLVGLYMLVGRFVVDALQRSHTYYGVTDQRAIIITGSPGKNVQSIMLHTLSDVGLRTGRGDKGTITFGSYPFWAPFSTNVSWPGMKRYTPPVFLMIRGARDVYDIIKQAQMEARRPGQETGWGRPEMWRESEESGASTRAL